VAAGAHAGHPLADGKPVAVRFHQNWLTKAAATVAHVGILGNGTGAAFMFAGPGRRNSFLRQHAAEAFDFQITCFLVYMVLVLGAAFANKVELLTDEDFLTLWAAALGLGTFIQLAFEGRASIAAWRGRPARYPPSVPLLRRRLPNDVPE
jgi:hypothetical protein